MLERRVTLFRIFGFAVRLHASWLLLGLLITWSLGENWFNQPPGLPAGLRYAFGAFGAIGLLFSIVFHELSHSLVARRQGTEIKGITLFLFGGVAEMEEEPKSARDEFFMAVVGPLSSFFLAGLFGGAWLLAQGGAWFPPLTRLLSFLAVLNLTLAIFNLVPAFPLDGGRVLRALLWGIKGDLRWATRVASALGRGFGLFLIILGVVQLVGSGFAPQAMIGGIWSVLIGFFLRMAAGAPYQQLLTREALAGETVRRFMVSEPITVPRAIPISELVEDYIYRHQRKVFPVVEGQRLLGCVGLDQVRTVPRDEWRNHTVGEIVQTCEDSIVGPDEAADEALQRMSRSGRTRLMVVEDGNLVGVLSLRDLLGFLALKLDLERR